MKQFKNTLKHQFMVLLALLLLFGLVPVVSIQTVEASAGRVYLESDIFATPSTGFTTSPMISGGSMHTVALRNDGTVWAWGRNTSGQLGDGTTISHRFSPVQVQNLNNVTAIFAGGLYTVALRNDGTVWAWGRNGAGQLGDGTTTDRFSPVQVQNLNNVTAISAGSNHTVALRNDGTVWAWGNNPWGQLGDGTTADRFSPVQVQNLNSVTAISAGLSHTVALRNDGTVWDWGDNWSGQLSGESARNRSIPVQVQNLNNVTAIFAGGLHTVALRSDGTVWAWGNNGAGQLGDGTTANRSIPVQVQNLNNVIAISAGHSHTVALRNDGTVWAWGMNGGGQLGDGTTTARSTPVQVQNLNSVTVISAGNGHTVTLRNDGTVWAWGFNNTGTLGDGTNIDRSTPVQVLGPNGVGHLNLGSTTTPPPSTITLTPSTISSINNTTLSATATVGGTATGNITLTNSTLPARVTASVNQTTRVITITGIRPAPGQPAITGGPFTVTVSRGGVSTMLTVSNVNLTPLPPGSLNGWNIVDGHIVFYRNGVRVGQGQAGPSGKYFAQGLVTPFVTADFLFNNQGHLLTGLRSYGNQWHYFHTTHGTRLLSGISGWWGWQLAPGELRYLHANGTWAADELITIIWNCTYGGPSQARYLFDTNGFLVTDFQYNLPGGLSVHSAFGEWHVMATHSFNRVGNFHEANGGGWFQPRPGVLRYLLSNGTYVTGPATVVNGRATVPAYLFGNAWTIINGHEFLFCVDGYLQFGWVYVDGHRVAYIGTNGIRVFGDHLDTTADAFWDTDENCEGEVADNDLRYSF